MGITEFEIIEKYFNTVPAGPDVELGIGDDCALLNVPAGKQLVVTTDTLVAGVHFAEQTTAADIAYKSIAVSLSDLAAMGAEPKWLMLSLTLPDVDENWLHAFSRSFNQTARHYNVQLVGGDTTRGPLSITVQASGLIEPTRAMRRDAAIVGDKIYVTGTLGDAAMALKLLERPQKDKAVLSACIDKLNRPVPRIPFAKAAAAYCRCAIDISDGLLADLGHILKASNCGADIQLSTIPLSDVITDYFKNNNSIDWQAVLAGGDDYELCLVVAEKHEAALSLLAENMQLALTYIGDINDSAELTCLDESGNTLAHDFSGFQHFS